MGWASPSNAERELIFIFAVFHERDVLQKKIFSAFHDAPEVQDEEYLNVLKSYTAKLEKRSEALQPILGRIERRQALVEERAKYEAMIADPNRLTSRGRGLSQLKENEMRIRVEKKLPKLEAALSEMVSKWETENEATLIFNGVKFLVRTRDLFIYLMVFIGSVG